MDKYLIKVGTAISSAAIVASSFITPALAITVEVSGNGTDSNNTVNATVGTNTIVQQTNNATIDNDVDVYADTGNNDANNNTGGDVSIDTGDADANATVNNTANANSADVSACCPGDINVTVKGNGAKSDNDVTVNALSDTGVIQLNNANVKNDVYVDADTGDNDANKNTGGDVSIETGDADASAEVSNTLNANSAEVGGNNGGATLSIEVSGNGAESDNNVDVTATSFVSLVQNNNASVENDVDVYADTGDNDANNNTGGDVSIDTGNATASADVSNLANFNAADVDACGCVFDEDSTVLVKGNGVDSDNDVTLALAAFLGASQNNDFACDDQHGWFEEWFWEHEEECNDVYVDADTGDNDVKKNTAGGDPSIETGDADANAEVENIVNANVLDDASIDFPDFPELGDSAGVLFAMFLALIS